MIIYVSLILLAFAISFIISFPYIKTLYKYNIRRTPKSELEAVLPGRKIKLGTPIMGGGIILISIIILASIYLYDWNYFWMIILICIVGGLFGFIDEYINTLGRTFKALRFSKASDEPKSLIPVKGGLLKVKKIILKPWKMFEESIRVMGSEQRGMKAHYKLIMQLITALIPILFIYFNGNGSFISIPMYGDLNLGFVYYLLLIVYFIFFINAFGITDGMDGLSAGTHSIAFGLFGILAASLGYTEVAILCFIIVGAELAFLYFNIKPARMEMSDVGTIPLGVLFATIPLLIHKEFAVLFIGLIFIVEIFSSVGQQWSVKLRGKRILKVAPIHHHFEKLGWSENKIVERFWLFTLISGLIGLFIVCL